MPQRDKIGSVMPSCEAAVKAASRHAISKLLAATEKCLAEEMRLDREICKTLRHLIKLLAHRYQLWTGRYLSIGPEHVFSAAELRQLIHARTASRSEFSHRQFAAIVRDELRKASEDCAYAISGLFRPNDYRVSPEPVARSTTPLIELLKRMQDDD